MGINIRRRLTLTASRIAIVAAAMALSGCSGLGFLAGSDETEAPQLVMPNPQDAASKAAYWGALYDADRNNFDAAVQFARHLRQVGGATQAVTLLKEVVMRAPDNTAVLSEYGKALTEAGRPADAIPFFSRALQADRGDWTVLSAYAVALDQTGSHKLAQANYDSALKISPRNPIVLANLAMSFVLEGNLGRGEEILRELVSRPDATPQARQNLAMIASLKGNRAEAENLLRQDLSPADAQNNMAIMQQLSSTNAPAQQPQPRIEPVVKAPPAAEGAKPVAPAATSGAAIAPTPMIPAAKPAPVTQQPEETEKSAALTVPPAALLERPTDSVVPLAKPRDTASLPLPARLRNEAQAQQASVSAATPAPQVPARRPIATMQPVRDDDAETPAVSTTTLPPAPKASAPAPTPAPAPLALRRSLAPDAMPGADGVEIAASAY